MKRLVGLCALMLVVLVSQTEQAKKTTPPLQVQDCSALLTEAPNPYSGWYYIQPNEMRTPFQVYCHIDSTGGWTVIQKRSGSYPSFTKNWYEYRDGFGSVSGDHWIGLENIYQLTKGRSMTLRVDLWDHENQYAYAWYRSFSVGDSASNYKLSLGDYSGTAGDAFRGSSSEQNQIGYGFSTIDHDNDGCNPCLFGDIAISQCTAINSGGWWYSKCGEAGLNGEYHPNGDHIGWASGLHWHTWKTGAPYSLRETRMMVRAD